MTRYTTPTLTWALPFEASYIAAAVISGWEELDDLDALKSGAWTF